MDMTDTHLAYPKPEKRITTKRRKSRKESTRKTSIRAIVKARDGYCRIGKDADNYLECSGVSEWCHFGAFKRARTRGQSPESRHTTAGSFMACTAHHLDYDSGELTITASDPLAGCDGDLVYARVPY